MEKSALRVKGSALFFCLFYPKLSFLHNFACHRGLFGIKSVYEWWKVEVSGSKWRKLPFLWQTTFESGWLLCSWVNTIIR